MQQSTLLKAFDSIPPLLLLEFGRITEIYVPTLSMYVFLNIKKKLQQRFSFRS